MPNGSPFVTAVGAVACRNSRMVKPEKSLIRGYPVIYWIPKLVAVPTMPTGLFWCLTAYN
ncbi:hypothetical protein DESC_740273 [Desulfosarcina cetonica]|nr:hypothetical protein DESC_740273 [Desulfosarcina cetonica]